MATVPCHWRCLTCDETGEGDRAAEKHVQEQHHAVMTAARRSTLDRLGGAA